MHLPPSKIRLELLLKKPWDDFCPVNATHDLLAVTSRKEAILMNIHTFQSYHLELHTVSMSSFWNLPCFSHFIEGSHSFRWSETLLCWKCTQRNSFHCRIYVCARWGMGWSFHTPIPHLSYPVSIAFRSFPILVHQYDATSFLYALSGTWLDAEIRHFGPQRQHYRSRKWPGWIELPLSHFTARWNHIYGSFKLAAFWVFHLLFKIEFVPWGRPRHQLRTV